MQVVDDIQDEPNDNNTREKEKYVSARVEMILISAKIKWDKKLLRLF